MPKPPAILGTSAGLLVCCGPSVSPPRDQTVGSGGPLHCMVDLNSNLKQSQNFLQLSGRLLPCREFFLRNSGVFLIELTFSSPGGGWKATGDVQIDGIRALESRTPYTLRIPFLSKITEQDLEKKVRLWSSCQTESEGSESCPKQAHVRLPTNVEGTAAISFALEYSGSRELRLPNVSMKVFVEE